MALQGGHDDPTNHKLRFGMDIGTSKIQIDAQHMQGTATLDDTEIEPANPKDGQSTRIEQVAIYLETGEVVYGIDDVEKAIMKNHKVRDRVLELWKLSLHPDSAHLDEVKHVIEILHAQEDRCAIEDFIADQLRQIILDVVEFYKNSSRNAGKDADYWDNINLELQLSVPVMWTDAQRGHVSQAARKALGASGHKFKVELREEPLCIATAYMRKLAKSPGFKVGSYLLIVDCGKGTFDNATVKLLRKPDPSKGVIMLLQRVGKCTGNHAGSHMINTLAWNYFLVGGFKDVPNVAVCCVKLDIPRCELQRQFSKEMDRIKNDYHDTRSGFSITIFNRDGKARPGRLMRLGIEVPREILSAWYDAWTDAAIPLLKQHLDEHHDEHYRYARLTGGGCLSSVFKNKIEAVLTQVPYNIEIDRPPFPGSACSQGALMQHYFQEDRLPTNGHFYFALTEEYEAGIHEDITALEAQVKPSEYNSNKKVIHGRLKKVDKRNGELVKTPMIFLVELNRDLGGRVHIDLVHKEADLADHSALQGDDDEQRSGRRDYPTVYVDVDEKDIRGYPVRNGSTGKQYIELRAFVQLHVKDDVLEVTLYIMLPDFRYRGELVENDGNGITNEPVKGSSFALKKVLSTHTRQVWHKDCSHFIRDTTGTTESQRTGTKRKGDAASTAPRRRRKTALTTRQTSIALRHRKADSRPNDA